MTEQSPLTPPNPEPVAGPVNTDGYQTITKEEAIQQAAADLGCNPDILRN